MGEQHLRGADAVLTEGVLVRFAQSHLADGRRRLQFVHRLRPFGPTEALATLGDRAAGDQQHLLAAALEFGDFAGPARERAVVEAAAVVGDQAGADLDDQAVGGVDDGLHGVDGRLCAKHKVYPKKRGAGSTG